MEQPVRLLSSDLDGTLIGKPDSSLDFHETWRCLDPGSRPVLVYNSGRLLEDTRRTIVRAGLPEPDFIICGVGTLIFDVREDRVVRGFSKILHEGWDRDRVCAIVEDVIPEAARQPDRFQSEFKCSWYAEDLGRERLDSLRERLDAEPDTHAHVTYSSGRDLDLLPKLANKGNALDWLLRELGVPREATVVAGDTGNDIPMFGLRGVRGIVVENAEPELIEFTIGRKVFLASRVCAAGVLEGMVHYGVVDRVRPCSDQRTWRQPHDPEIKKLLEEAEVAAEDDAHRDFLATAYEQAVSGLRRCITPMGFSACSIGDNEIRGTDANYHSVWARDGCISVIGSIRLADEDFRACQKNTLTTLLEHVSPTGQVPANVNLGTRQPDYSGVGGIASIDSGMWLILAVQAFVRATRDVAFLRRHRGTLQRVMDWLSAHDSNNDGLLEIPEAGDWMDLFNRSYNVLVDEVIWYRTNVAFGRLLEQLGEHDQASAYVIWSESIKRAIGRKFWPSTSPAGDASRDGLAFTDIQKSVGDASYLLAQVAPFSFDWRCDVFGNVLAFLFNVLDIERAKTAFRFMWGVGVNEPFPVKNLYPVVNAGDPDWRAYYTVNLLNLPHHYHNGGIWPFIGGMWVRFVNRLGLREIAYTELVKLAELNRKGINEEWEFNEWMHGVTGRPMGKRYQAWSCSEFIHAYQDIVTH